MPAITLILFITSLSLFANDKKICLNFYFDGESVELTDNEKIFICGSKDTGWKKIPFNQAKTWLESFLESRAYFQSNIRKVKDRVLVSIGKQSFIKSVEFLDPPKGFDDIVYQGAVGLELTESNLTEIQNWTQTRLESIGYPCSEIKIAASYISEEVLVQIIPNEKVYINRIVRESIPELNKESYSRHDAINKGDLYNADFLFLTSRRIIRSGLVSYSYFTHSCKNKGQINQKLVLNKPNLVILGVGASTEEFPILKASWKNSRIDKNGSSFETLLYLSSVERSIEVNTTFFLLKNTPRLYLKPYVRYEEITENIYETKSKIFGGYLGYDFDIENYALSVDTGPSFTDETQTDGEAPSDSEFVSLEFNLGLTSHYYEYFISSPRNGQELLFNLTQYNGTNDKNENTQGKQLTLKGTKLINFGDFDPPNMILGFRFHYSSLLTEKLENTPQKYRLYLGGEKDIRGFARKTINNSEIGFKTTAHLAIESRYTNLLPHGLQPLAFIDFAKVGFNYNSFEDITLYSPGIGLRWQSPFGSFRTTLAKGMKSNDQLDVKEQWNFFFSYGREF